MNDIGIPTSESSASRHKRSISNHVRNRVSHQRSFKTDSTEKAKYDKVGWQY